MEFDVYELNTFLTKEKYEELQKFLAIDIIKAALTNDRAFIAGGFARSLLTYEKISDYLWPKNHTSEYRAGDIDIFFTSIENANQFVNHDAHKRLYKSQGGFAKDITCFVGSDENSVNIQFVDHPDLCHGSIEATLRNFDFMNCAVAITKTHIWIPKDWSKWESQRLIHINHANSPFLGTRLTKYIKYRNYNGLTEESQHFFTDWLIKASNQKFEDKLYNNSQHMVGLQSAVRSLNKLGSLTKETLLFFIGKWRETICIGNSQNYGEKITVEVDWALNALKTAKDEIHTSA